MDSVEPLQVLHRARPTGITPGELEHIAFSGNADLAHGLFRSIPLDDRPAFANRYILSEVVAGGILKLRKFLAASAEAPASQEKEFIDATLRFFIATCRESGSRPRELFRSIIQWSDELVRLSLLREALQFYEEGCDLGINKFPDLHVKLLLGKGSVLHTLGNLRESRSILQGLADRPYAIPDRNLVPEVLLGLGMESLLAGDVDAHKKILFQGLRHFSTRIAQRQPFVERITRAYRRPYRVALDRRVPVTNRLLYFLHRLHFRLDGIALLRRAGLTQGTRVLLLAYVYFLNYGPGSGATGVRSRSIRRLRPRRSGVLVTRGMGGIGDLLMMTPGLAALKRHIGDEEIHLAIPRRYFPVFEGNNDVRLLDIETDPIDPLRYRQWRNFTDCPASRVESRSAPRVRRGRIEIFARALGIGAYRLRKTGRRPRYTITPEERLFQMKFWRTHGLEERTVIGVQLRADEVYRDYPFMRQLISTLAREYAVLVFDAEPIEGFAEPGVITVGGCRMRQAFALASACDAIVAPDSAFVHLAAAFDIPCVALYGPIDGKVRTRDYPNCRTLDARPVLGCAPCWRNAEIPCKLTGMRSSVCMAEISTQQVVSTLKELLRCSTPTPRS